MSSSTRAAKHRLIQEITEFLQQHSYDAEEFAKYVYAKSLDERSYRYEDEELDSLLGLLSGMSAGPEFYYSKSEVLEMLDLYKSASH